MSWGDNKEESEQRRNPRFSPVARSLVTMGEMRMEGAYGMDATVRNVSGEEEE